MSDSNSMVTSTNGVHSTAPFARPSIEGHGPQMQDPWDWTVEEVICSLCDRSSIFLRTNGTLSLPDLNVLAKALRENDVNGLALLTEIQSQSLRDYLGIRSMSHCGSINYIVRQLRGLSSKYREHFPPSDDRISSVGGATRFVTPLSGSPQTSWKASSWLQSPLNALSPTTGQFSAGDAPDIPKDQAMTQPLNVLADAPVLPRPDHIPSALSEQTETAHHTDGLESSDRSVLKDDQRTSEYLTPMASPPSVGDPSRVNEKVAALPIAIGTAIQDRQGETTIIDATGRKRRRLVLLRSSSRETAEDERRELRPSSSRILEGTERGCFTKAPEAASLSAPTNDEIEAVACVESIANANGLTSSRTEELKNHPEYSTSNETDPNDSPTSDESPKAGTQHKDEQGRKRVIPILISQSDAFRLHAHEANKPRGRTTDAQFPLETFENSDTDPVTSIKQLTYERKPDQMYLGPKALAVDRLFYDESLLPAQSENTEEIGFVSAGITSSGLRQYVNARMKYFLRCLALSVGPEAQGRLGIIPYPSRIITKKQQPLFMTIFSNSPDGVTVSKESRSKWIKDGSKPHQAFADENSSVNLFNLSDPASAKNEENHDAELAALEKWNYVAGGDEILPAYGESGSEAEYDLDTWREMEEEKGDMIPRPLGNSKSAKLARADVQEAIDVAVQHIIEEWHYKRWPKLQLKARLLWVRSRRDCTLRNQVEALMESIRKLDIRLQRLRKEILGEQWSKTSEIARQCKIMQPSIFDREDKKWASKMLKSKEAPEKASLNVGKSGASKVKEPEQPLESDEELVASETSPSEYSDCSFDDFVVEDEISADADWPLLVDDDVTMADAEYSNTSIAGMASPGPTSIEDKNEPKPSPVLENTIAKLDVKQRVPSDIIDLTQQSDPIQPDTPLPKPERKFQIKTPPILSEGDKEFFSRSERKKPQFKMPRTFPTQDAEVIDLESDSAATTSLGESPTRAFKSLPKHSDINQIKAMDPNKLVESQDRKRLLIWLVAHSRTRTRIQVSNTLDSLSMELVRAHVMVGLKCLLAHKYRISGVDNELSESIMQVAAWYVCWTIPVKLQPVGLNTSHVEIALSDEEGFELFYDFLLNCLGPYEKELARVERLQSTPLKSKQRKVFREDLDKDPQNSPSRQRKYVVPESQEAMDERQSAQKRFQEDEERRRNFREADERRRRRELKSRRSGMGNNKADSLGIVVNPGKHEDQECIRLTPRFGSGAPLKPHQIEGLQFMWREITANHQKLQGCLIAQTMGLGKTMQVIALLVTIAEATKSSSFNVRQQVPSSLRESRTLILLPPALVENWWDEFLLWAPEPFSDHFGELRKVSGAMKVSMRLSETLAWSENGGVLLIGYDTFKGLVHNKARTAKNDKSKMLSPPLNDAEHQKIKIALLETPNIVIADEAHQFKNMGSSIYQAVSQIQTKSRIALTGSPLSNNLGEYYTLVNWIAPNYLGTYQEFNANRAEPIQEGLYQDSTDAQYRHSRKVLRALELELEPKIHRADFSAIHNELKGKIEFVIRVPLTKLQDEVYRAYVNSTLTASRGNEPRKALLWTWLSVLRLLCNHPKCFRERILATAADSKSATKPKNPTQTKNEPRQTIAEEALLGSDVDVGLLDEPISQVAMSQVIVETQKIFEALPEPLDDLSLSNKMKILMDILNFSENVSNKVLVFSHSIPTLDFVGSHLQKIGKRYERIDGKTLPQRRQSITKDFNEGNVNICLVSTRAGGQGLNLFGANRVVILDDHFNPMWEQQAIGRAYRIGQTKPVFVYRLTVAGTFEQAIQNQALFKEQLATRVVDKKNPTRNSLKGAAEYLFPPKAVKQELLDEFVGKDPQVLDRILTEQTGTPILSITPSDTFHLDDGVELTPQEKREAEQMHKDEQLRRQDPSKYVAIMNERRVKQLKQVTKAQANSSHGSLPLENTFLSTEPRQWHGLPSPTGIYAPPSMAPMANIPLLESTYSSTASQVANRSRPLSFLSPVLNAGPEICASMSAENQTSVDHAHPRVSEPQHGIISDQYPKSTDLALALPATREEDTENHRKYLHTSASVLCPDEDKSVSKEALKIELDDLFGPGTHAYKISLERLSVDIRKAVQEDLSEATSKNDLENTQKSLPYLDLQSNYRQIHSLIQLVATNKADFHRLWTRVKSLLERDNIDARDLCSMIKEKLEIEALSTIEETHSSSSSSGNIEGYYNDQTSLESNNSSRVNEKPTQEGISKKQKAHLPLPIFQKSRPSNTTDHQRRMIGVTSTTRPQKHGLPQDGVQAAKKSKTIETTTPGFGETGEIENRFSKFPESEKKAP